jgi:hypothetical protein
VGKTEENRPLGRPRHRWENYIKLDLREERWGGTDWIDLAQDRNRWQAVLSVVKKLHRMREIFCVSEELLISQKGLYSMGLVYEVIPTSVLYCATHCLPVFSLCRPTQLVTVSLQINISQELPL